MALDKGILRTVKVKQDESIIPFVSTFNPKDPEIFPDIINNLPILEKDEKMNDIISNYKFIKSRRQPNTLKRLLTKAKFTSTYEHTVKKCNRPNCSLCTHLLEGNYFTFNCGTRFKIHEDNFISCDVKNVICVMKCRGCGKEYIGETGKLLRKRVTVQNQHIRDPKTRMLKVSEHIENCANLLEQKYNIFPFYKMYTNSFTLRRSKEKLFIKSLQPKLNRAI